MKLPTITACVALLAAPFLAGCASNEGRRAQDLFNGTDLTGWTAVQSEWTAADGVLSTTGRTNGYIRTNDTFKNYKLTLEWRWDGVAPKKRNGTHELRNSGVLLHQQDQDAVWPHCIEAQLRETDAGDFYMMGGTLTNEIIALRAQENTFTELFPKGKPSSEKPIGEWNRYEIVCENDTVVVTVNGTEQNRATGVTVSEGRICLQSEGTPISFRNIRIEPL